MTQANSKGKSPYRRHNKRPYRYSDLYQRWRAAARSGDADEAARVSKAHKRRFLDEVSWMPERLAA
jgi:hypothetical protein